MNSQVSWINEAQVLGVLNLAEARLLVRDAYSRVARGANKPMPKITAGTPQESAHCLASVDMELKIAGFKTWVNSPKGALPIISLFDLEAGRILGVVEAMALGNLRTAAVAALGTELLSPQEAKVFLMVGAGRQALFQIAAAAHARPFEKLLVWSRDPLRATALARSAQDLLQRPIEVATDLRAAVEQADVITTMTRASKPFLPAEYLKKTVHINALGAIIPNAAELQPDVFELVTAAYIDDPVRANADFELQAASADLIHPVWDLLQAGSARPAGVTVFKSWGLGAADLMLAHAAYLRSQGGECLQIEYPKAPVFSSHHLCDA